MKSDSDDRSGKDDSDASSIGLDLPETIIPSLSDRNRVNGGMFKYNSKDLSKTKSTASKISLPVKKRPPMSQFALHYIILIMRQAGRRLAMSDITIARACSLMHRTLSVFIRGKDESELYLNSSTDADRNSNWVDVRDIDVDDPDVKQHSSLSSIKKSIKASLGDIDPHTLGMACLNLAGKIQEEHQRLRDVVLAYHRCMNPQSKKATLDPGEDYDNLRETLVQSELLIMRILSFNVRRPQLPHAYMLHYLNALTHWIGKGVAFSVKEDQMTEKQLSLARLPGVAWSILADSYHAPLCMEYNAEHIAASILHLSLRISGVEVPGNRQSELAWWQAISNSLDREIVEKIQMKVMLVYGADDLMPPTVY